MADPTLSERLAKVSHPTLVAWGASDQVVDVACGRAYGQAIPGAEFRLLAGTGHMPHVETPGQLLSLVRDFADSHSVNRPQS
ncbi:alpha/beta fold hydrolase [Streptomyces sp. NPDC058686]|uniref:alpha/beta fold hydrolase n=1 Tax=Streptomyces sp. NPDC058686 TaxID=3346599 RepID=UPI00364D095E